MTLSRRPLRTVIELGTAWFTWRDGLGCLVGDVRVSEGGPDER